MKRVVFSLNHKKSPISLSQNSLIFQQSKKPRRRFSDYAMAADNEPAKLLLPYLQRADELQKHEPIIAYYCKAITRQSFRLALQFILFGEFWEPIRAFKSRLRELQHNSSSEFFEGIKNSEFVEKFKSSLKSICRDPNASKEVPPFDVPKLLACLVRQCRPFLDQIGIDKGKEEEMLADESKKDGWEEKNVYGKDKESGWKKEWHANKETGESRDKLDSVKAYWDNKSSGWACSKVSNYIQSFRLECIINCK